MLGTQPCLPLRGATARARVGGGGLEEVLYRELQGLEEGLQRFQLEPILFTVTDCHGLLGYRSS